MSIFSAVVMAAALMKVLLFRLFPLLALQLSMTHESIVFKLDWHTKGQHIDPRQEMNTKPEKVVLYT